ncbi:MAG TPA: heterodisulfide reductase-related iron-sulfur binding cluster, partial [Phenylobacterium sp.]|nr:heterodisulfide reductase-related iron-sulfur binding cluster [Phenylobacterium sp.]
CPTYVLTGDERDGPRGRIELIRAMLEGGGPPPASTVTHIDRCLSCLACTTTCPSGVDYAQLIDHARAYIETHYERPWPERLMRAALAWVLPHPRRLRVAMALGRLARPLGPMFESLGLKPLTAMLRLLPPIRARAVAASASAPTRPRGRVVLLQGCVEPVMAPEVRAAATRLLTRMGFEVVLAPGEQCCGALCEHLGRADEAHAMAQANLRAWAALGQVDAVIATAAGCGTALKGYAAGPPTKDVLEFVAEVGLPPVTLRSSLPIAYHAACSLQHGQQVKAAPPRLLAEAGFEVRLPAEGHLCCGSAGVYNILQPEFATRLRDRKAANLTATGAAVIAAGNVGCMAQLAPVLGAPIVHPVELLDWATGGPRPAKLSGPLNAPLSTST